MSDVEAIRARWAACRTGKDGCIYHAFDPTVADAARDIEAILAALTQARKEGAEEERERLAKLAEEQGVIMKPGETLPWVNPKWLRSQGEG